MPLLRSTCGESPLPWRGICCIWVWTRIWDVSTAFSNSVPVFGSSSLLILIFGGSSSTRNHKLIGLRKLKHQVRGSRHIQITWQRQVLVESVGATGNVWDRPAPTFLKWKGENRWQRWKIQFKGRTAMVQRGNTSRWGSLEISLDDPPHLRNQTRSRGVPAVNYAKWLVVKSIHIFPHVW